MVLDSSGLIGSTREQTEGLVRLHVAYSNCLHHRETAVPTQRQESEKAAEALADVVAGFPGSDDI